jgi:hypothetical protein
MHRPKIVVGALPEWLLARCYGRQETGEMLGTKWPLSLPEPSERAFVGASGNGFFLAIIFFQKKEKKNNFPK